MTVTAVCAGKESTKPRLCPVVNSTRELHVAATFKKSMRNYSPSNKERIDLCQLISVAAVWLAAPKCFFSGTNQIRASKQSGHLGGDGIRP
jgi:hypothetical protein